MNKEVLTMMDFNSKIYVAGHLGMVGSSIVRALNRAGYYNIIGKSIDELDLCNQNEVNLFFKKEKPDYVILAAAKVGGIMANIQSPADFIWINTMIECNIIKACHDFGVKKMLFLASSCIYPRLCPQPMKEEYLMDGKVEPTNEGYALAKIVGLKMCEFFSKQYGDNFVSIMPCNLFGMFDNFDPEKSHVIPALIRRFHEAKVNNDEKVVVWGTGNARRELLFTDDVADACVFMLNEYNDREFLNVGAQRDYTIREIAEIIKKVVGFKGEIEFDTSKPDGMPQKLMDSTKLYNYGWKPKHSFEESLEITYKWFLDNVYGR